MKSTRIVKTSDFFSSLRYLFGLDLAHWAQRNKVATPWWLLTWTGFAVSLPIFVGIGALTVGVGYLVGIFFSETSSGLGVILAISMIISAKNIFISGSRTRVTHIVFPADGQNFSSFIHPWALLFRYGILTISGKAILRVIIFILLSLGCTIGSNNLNPYILFALISIGFMESSLGIKILLNKLDIKPKKDFRSLFIKELIASGGIILFTFYLSGRAASLLKVNHISDESILSALYMIDRGLLKYATHINYSCLLLGLVAFLLVIYKFILINKSHYKIPGSLRVNLGEVIGPFKFLPIIGVGTALAKSSLLDSSRSSFLWRFQSIVTFRCGIAFIGVSMNLKFLFLNPSSQLSENGIIAAMMTLTLMLAISQVSSQGAGSWENPIKLFIDLGMSRNSAVLGYYLSASVFIILPLIPTFVAMQLLAHEVTIVIKIFIGCLAIVFGTFLADLVDTSQAQHADGTSEPGLMGGVLSGIFTTLTTILLVVNSAVTNFILPALPVFLFIGVVVLFKRRLVSRGSK